MQTKRFKTKMSLILTIALIFSTLPGVALNVIATDGESSVLPDHLIINQAYGNGKNADGSVSHSFIEIYNPTETEVDLSGWSLQYAENGASWSKLDLNGVILPSTSYLIRANGGRTINTRYEIYYADEEWPLIISNDSFKFALVNHQDALSVYNPTDANGVVDLLGAYNAPAIPLDYGEGSGPKSGVSKQKSARRNGFTDTDDNTADFEIIDYRSPDINHPNYNASGVSDDKLLEVRPRSSRDGVWVAGDKSPLPVAPDVVSISFGKPAGLYENQFDLELGIVAADTGSASGYVIRYTLDGEDPTAGSPVYASPLTMKDRTADHEVMVQKTHTTSALSMHGTYVRPDLGTVFKGTVVKAQVFDTGGNPVTGVATNSYFVNGNIFSRYGNLPIISVATPADYFFDLGTGIYVRGDYENDPNYIYPDNRPEWNGVVWNWDQSWERPVHFEMFDPAAGYNRVVSQGMGVRIHGGVSRNSAQKSLRFYARNGMVENLPLHNGASSVDYDLFQGEAKDYKGNAINDFQRFTIRAHGNDIASAMLRDSLVNVIARDFSNETQAYRPVVAFLNGEYWGLYQMTERYDDRYLESHYGGNKDYYDILENPSTIEMTDANGTEESRSYFLATVSEINKIANMNTPEAYAKVLEYVDEDSLIDYTVIKTFIGDNDWVNRTNYNKKRHGNNNEMWRYTGAPTGSPGQDGRYRFLLKDSDMAFIGGLGENGGGEGAGSQGMAFDSIAEILQGAALQNHYFFGKLMQNSEFKAKFINRYMDLLNTDLSFETMGEVLNQIAEEIKPVVPEQKQRWNYTLDLASWQNEINWIKAHMAARTSQDPAISGITKGLNALANASRAQLAITEPDNGSITLNGMDLTYSESVWSGTYYAGFEQTVKAAAAPGYKLKHFVVNGVEVPEPAYTFTMPAEGAAIEAVFEERGENPEYPPLIINQAAAVNEVTDGSADGALSHGFVEIYNPTDEPFDISGWSLQYMKNGDTSWQVLNLAGGEGGVLPPRHSYLIRMKSEVPPNTANRLLLSNIATEWPVGPYGFDQEWAGIAGFGNSSFMYALVANQNQLPYGMPDVADGVVDFVGAGNDIKADFQWGTYEVIKMSKQQSVRRTDFVNTFDNFADFTNIDYRYQSAAVRPAGLTTATNSSGITDEEFLAYRPRSLVDGAWPLGGGSDYPDNPSVIINQAIGIGDVANDSSPGAVEYSFVELYNPTDAAVDVSGWSLQYAESGTSWVMLKLSGEIPAKNSYLVRANGASPNARLFIPDADLDWDGVIISNRSFKIALVSNQVLLEVKEPTAADGVMDLVGADNPNNFADYWWGSGAVAKFSKQQAVRRVDFVNTFDNKSDFVSIDYRTADINEFYPRSLADGAWPSGGGNPGYLPNHLIINQAAGIGDITTDSSDKAIEYSFVELYNPTDKATDVSGWSLQYAESGSEWTMCKLEGVILPRTSYLVRATKNGPNLPGTRLFIPDADMDWGDVVISNRVFKFALVNHQNPLTVYNPAAAQGVVDLVGANNSEEADWFEGSGPASKMSKQQAARRINFSDYDQNWYDFEAADYRSTGKAGQNIETYRPRWSGDGAWGLDLTPPPPPPSTEGTIVFNKPAGIYPAAFGLELSTTSAGAVIRYTLDGEDPTSESAEYTAPLPMTERIAGTGGDPHKLLWNLRTTGPRNEMPSYSRDDIGALFRGTVVKARLFGSDGEPVSDIYVNSYFVNGDVAALYGELPVVSMSTPAGYLFDNENNGIYVKGVESSDGLDSGPYNFDQKGSEWERPVYFEMFDPASGAGWETHAVVDQGMGLRIHGGASRHFPQKSLRFYARTGSLSTNVDDANDGILQVINGSNSVNYDMFNGGASSAGGNALTGGFKRFMLRAGGNDAEKSFIRDAISSSLTSGVDTIETQGYRPAVLFINGEFWGVFEMLERFDDEYLAQHFGGNSSDYRILENPSGIGKTSADDNDLDAIAYYETTIAAVEGITDMNTQEAYEMLEGIVDIDSLIDYVVIETLGGNTDWVQFSGTWESYFGTFVYNGNNQRMWYYTGADDGQPGHDGRFRWMLYDTDKSWGYEDSNQGQAGYNTIADTLIQPGTGTPNDNLYFFRKLMENDAFRFKFVSRYLEALDEWLDLSVMTETVDDLAAEIAAALVQHRIRWPYTYNEAKWATEISGIKSWMAARANPSGAFVKALKGYADVPGYEQAAIYAAAYAGEPDSLPQTVELKADGGTAVQAAVLWDVEKFLAAEAYDTIALTGTAVGSGTPVTAVIEVIPRGLVYYIDSGTLTDYQGWGMLYKYGMPPNITDEWKTEPYAPSAAYNAVKALVGGRLLNNVPDRLYAESYPAGSRWGVEPEGILFPVAYVDEPLNKKLASGFVGNGGSSEGAPESLEYKLYLPAGEYKITTGHFCWWSPTFDDVTGEPTGGYPREMEVRLNGVPCCTPFEFSKFGDSDVLTFDYHHASDGELTIDIKWTKGDGQVVSFIGVQDVGGDEVIGTVKDVYAAYVGEADSLPRTVDLLYKSGITENAEVVWDVAPFSTAKAFDTVALTGTVKDGAYAVEVAIEVIPRELVYYVDAGTAQIYKDGLPVYPGTVESLPDDGVQYGNGTAFTASAAYGPVVEKLAEDGWQLRNGASDQLFDGTWGLNPDAYQFPVSHVNPAVGQKLATGYVGWDDRDGDDYETRNKYIEYTLYLPEGDYSITTGHYCWWSLMYDDEGKPNGGYPRTMEVLFNGEAPEGGTAFTFKDLGDFMVKTYNFSQKASGLLSISIPALLGGDGATLSFIGVEDATGEHADDIVEIKPVYAAAYLGEEASLPQTVEALFRSGKTEPVEVSWDTVPFTNADAYEKIALTGTVEGSSLTAAATIEVVPRNLLYFIDAGTVGVYPPINEWLQGNVLEVEVVDGEAKYQPAPGPVGSPAYDAVAAKLAGDGKSLLNEASDKLYSGTWGLAQDAYQFPVAYLGSSDGKLSTGYVGWDLRPWDPTYDDKNAYIEYVLELPAGEYLISTGHYCWWDPEYDEDNILIGGLPRTMEVLFNGKVPDGGMPFTFNGFGQNKIVTYSFVQEEAGNVSIRSAAVSGDGPTLTFIGIEAVERDSIVSIVGDSSMYVAAYAGEPETLPEKVEVLFESGATGMADIVWDNGPFLDAELYDIVSLAGTVKGSDLAVTADVEVIPRDLRYFIDAGTIGTYPYINEWLQDGVLKVDVTGGEIIYTPAPGPAGSPAYNAVVAKLAEDGEALLNEASDKLYGGAWGLNPEAYQFPVAYLTPLNRKLTTGYVGWDLRPWDMDYDGKNTYIEYKLALPKGAYRITTGHYCWWDKSEDGGYPREMAVQFDGVIVGKLVDFDTFGQNKVASFGHYQEEDGELAIRILTTEGDGAVLSFIGVQEVEVPDTPFHTVTFMDGETVLNVQQVRHEAPALAPEPPEKEGYAFVGWDVSFKCVTSDLTVNAQYEAIIDRIVSLEGKTSFYEAVYIGGDDLPNLPGTIRALYNSGKTENVDVVWDYELLADAGAYSLVVLTGTIEGSDLTLTARVEMIPQDLVIFVDAGTNGAVPWTTYVEQTEDGESYVGGPSTDVSAAYDLISAKLAEDGKSLLNEVPDKFYGGDWGLNEEAYQFQVAFLDSPDLKLSTGYVGFDDWEIYGDKNQFIEYTLELKRGDYIITTGHYCWWGPMYDDVGEQNGGYPREMEIMFNGVTVEAPFTLSAFGQNRVCSHSYKQIEDGKLVIRVSTVSGDGAVLSFIGVQDVTAPAFMYGDVDDNGRVAPMDASLLSRYLADWPGIVINKAAADVNADGEITTLDLTILQRHIAGWPGYETLPYQP